MPLEVEAAVSTLAVAVVELGDDLRAGLLRPAKVRVHVVHEDVGEAGGLAAEPLGLAQRERWPARVIMMTPLPSTSSPCTTCPSSSATRSRGVNPNAFCSQSKAFFESSYISTGWMAGLSSGASASTGTSSAPAMALFVSADITPSSARCTVRTAMRAAPASCSWVHAFFSRSARIFVVGMRRFVRCGPRLTTSATRQFDDSA